MTNVEATITENAATVAEQGAHVAPEKASPKKGATQKKGAPKGQKAAKGRAKAAPKKEARAGKKAKRRSMKIRNEVQAEIDPADAAAAIWTGVSALLSAVTSLLSRGLVGLAPAQPGRESA